MMTNYSKSKKEKMTLTKSISICGKLFTCFMTVTLMVLVFSFPVFAKANTGKAMRISNVQGVVATQTADLKNKAAVKNMVLDDVIRVASGEKSYCWIKLDNNKLVKLDSLSDVTLIRNGKAYDVYLNSGNVFFDVTKKLKAGEALRFHSGGVVTNITGTSGFITVDENGNTSVTILEGRTEVSYQKPLGNVSTSNGQAANSVSSSAQIATVAVSSGYALNVNSNAVSSNAALTAVPINSTSIPGFVAVEIKNDISLQKKIQNANTLVDVALVKNQADNLLVVNEISKAQSIEIKRQEKIEIERKQQEEREKAQRDRQTSRKVGAETGSHEHSFNHRFDKDIDKVKSGQNYLDVYDGYDVFVWTGCSNCNGEFQHAIRLDKITINAEEILRNENKKFIRSVTSQGEAGPVTENVDIGSAYLSSLSEATISATAYCKACEKNVDITCEQLIKILQAMELPVE